MKLVQKYISAGAHPDRQAEDVPFRRQCLAKVKEQVKESTWQLAKELLGLYSERSIIEGKAFNTDTHWQQEFEAAFIYEETPDKGKLSRRQRRYVGRKPWTGWSAAMLVMARQRWRCARHLLP